jgi:hypothetical protein
MRSTVRLMRDERLILRRGVRFCSGARSAFAEQFARERPHIATA